MRSRQAIAVALLVLLSSTVHQAVLGSGPASESPTVRIAVPIPYTSPEAWSQVIGSAPGVGLVIFNPDSGPGASKNPEAASFIARAQAEGIKVLGYVPTEWASGTITVRSAESMIEVYLQWYRVDGIFLDEANSTCDGASEAFYGQLYSMVKGLDRSDLVVLNPGTSTGECYASVSDIIATFENNYSNYSAMPSQDWMRRYPSARFMNVVYDVPTISDMKAVVSAASLRNVGWVYVSDLGAGRSYSGLPSYFAQEVEFTESFKNQTAAAQAEAIHELEIKTLMVGILVSALAGSAFVLARGEDDHKHAAPNTRGSSKYADGRRLGRRGLGPRHTGPRMQDSRAAARDTEHL